MKKYGRSVPNQRGTFSFSIPKKIPIENKTPPQST